MEGETSTQERIRANEDNYDRLVVTLEASGGLSLSIASCDDRAFQEQIIRRYEGELAAMIPCYRIQLGYEEPSLRSALSQVVAEHPQLRQGGDAVVTVTLGEGMAAAEVDRFFGYLQWTREGLREFPYAIALWITPQILKQMSRAAPDFWSWRSGVFRFAAPAATATTAESTPQNNEVSLPETAATEDSLPIEELLQSVAEIEAERGTQAPALATLYDRLGQAYRNRALEKRGKARQPDLDEAIAFFQKAIDLQRVLEDNSNLANTLNRLGDVYGDLGKYDRAINLYKHSIEIARQMGDRIREASFSIDLGIAYWKNPLGKRAENLEQAIASYENALQIRTREAFPVNWAMTQNNLAIAYMYRIRGEKADNLERAIQSYENALQIRTRDDFPEQWATTQNNLAIAYRNRIRGEKADNLENAIQLDENALEVYTRDDFPEQWAMTQNNLAIAYMYRIRGEKADNLERAIQSYENALEVSTRDAFPVNWAQTQNNLGNAYVYRIRGEKAENLERAIQSYENALEVSTRDAFPVNWAQTQNNLGEAYRNRIRGEKADNLERAIQSYENALQIYTRDAFPHRWKIVEKNLKIARDSLGERGRHGDGERGRGGEGETR